VEKQQSDFAGLICSENMRWPFIFVSYIPVSNDTIKILSLHYV